jgi:hypothetical protein
MNNSINLLTPEHINATQRQRVQYIRYIALTCMALIVTLSVSVFFLILASPLPALRREESTLKLSLQSLRQTSAKLFLTKERLGIAQGIMKKRPAFDSYVSRIMQELPQGANISSVDITPSSFTVSVSAPSLLTMNSFIGRMQTLQAEEKLFKTVTLTTLIYDEKTPDYSVALTVKL